MFSSLNVNLLDSTIHGSSVLSPAPTIPRLLLSGSPILVGRVLPLASCHLLCVYDQSLPRDLGGACSVTCTQLEWKITIAEWIDAYLSGHPEARSVSPEAVPCIPRHPAGGHMESSMLFTLLGLCVGTASDTGAQGLSPFDAKQFNKGFWYEIAFASTIDDEDSENNEKLGALKDLLEMHLLKVTNAYYKNKRCVLEKVPALAEDGPGKFRVSRGAVNRNLYIEVTDYKTFYIIFSGIPAKKPYYKTLKLYTRSLDNTDQALKRFKHEVLAQGFPEESIHVYRHDLSCVPSVVSMDESLD